MGIANKVRGTRREVDVGEKSRGKTRLTGREAGEVFPGGFEEVGPRAGAVHKQRK